MDGQHREAPAGSGLAHVESGEADERFVDTSLRAVGRVLTLPRRLFRKIVVEPTDGGWRAHVVGFDARFYSSAKSPPFRTRSQALEAAAIASRHWGLPVITVETLANSDPDLAA